MNHRKSLQDLVRIKTKNIITDKKAEEIIRLIKIKFPTTSLEEKFQDFQKYSELPSWLNDAVTINETYFFRHHEHFDELSRYFQQQKASNESVKVLCVGVSTGEEAYSVAFLAREECGDNFQIFGVDLSPEAIQKAEKGIYEQNLINRASSTYQGILSKYLVKIKGINSTTYKVPENIKSNIKFKCSNIFNIPLDMYDVVLIRNIMIYFDDVDKERLIKKIISHIKKNGMLFIGAGEILPPVHLQQMEGLSTSVYKKVA